MMGLVPSTWCPVVAAEQSEMAQMRGGRLRSPLLNSRYEVTLQGSNSRPASSDPTCWSIFASIFGIGNLSYESSQR